ncbi:MAG: Hpt domain-containing protein [Marinobacter sp.]|uniref:Hpt domain-containing protein n=1 Tax=Marinobacter sp. TaxID=50741 RepID=UPI00299E1064|nr:Hpt domain-containing protein [Marinobacter sp.]MDX1633473.1 Hpt domain-containing protein [Marinobacter sp.]
MNDKPHLDEEALAELQEVMEDEFDILIRTYLSDSEDRIRTLRNALGNGDADAFAKSAHSFKGSCFNIGAPQLGSLCLAAEIAGREGSLVNAEAQLAAIENEFQVIREMLQRSIKS